MLLERDRRVARPMRQCAGVDTVLRRFAAPGLSRAQARQAITTTGCERSRTWKFALLGSLLWPLPPLLECALVRPLVISLCSIALAGAVSAPLAAETIHLKNGRT